MRFNYMDLLRRGKQTGITVYRRIFSKRTASGLTTAELFNLYIIDLMDGPTIKDFASFLGISQPNATYRINALVEKGYVEKMPSLTDRRESHLLTTKKCRKLMKEDGRSAEALEIVLKSRFSEEQLDCAREVLEAVLEFLEEE